MKNISRGWTFVLGPVALAALTACGGGGGFDVSSGQNNSSGGTSGSVYAVALTSQGAAATRTYGLSLIQPGATESEFVIEAPTAGVLDLAIVSSGTVTVDQATVSGIQPFAALYIVGGDIRRVPLVANGTAPAGRVQRAGVSGACRFVLNANDYAAPEQSRLVVSTAGADAACGTADDGQSDVTLTSAGGLTVTPVTGPRRLGIVRDTARLAPQGWFTTDNVTLFTPSAGVLPYSAPATSVVLGTNRSAVVETRGALSVLDLGTAAVGTGLSETQLPANLTAGTGWRSIGFDSTDFFVYRSGTTLGSSSWSVLRINRQSKAVTQLSGGSGVLSSVGLGQGLIYATESTPANNRVLTISKSQPGPANTLRSRPSTTLLSVTTGTNGRHQLWERPVTGTAGYVLDFISEANNTSLLNVPGGVPLAEVQATTLNLGASQNTGRFVFAGGYGASGLSGAVLQSYDAGAGVSDVYGTLPGSSRYGADQVEVGVTSTPGPFLGGYAGRVGAGGVQASDEVTFSFDARTPGSLRLATTRR